MATQRPFTWRVENIPRGTTDASLKQYFHSDDRKFIEVKSLVPDVNNYDGAGTLTATIIFNTPESREPRIDNDEEITLDKDFLGFTPLNETRSDAAAEWVKGISIHSFSFH